MTIQKLTIANFRSIRQAELNCSSINALVGSNNAGKSNILRALNLVLGATYPSVRSFEDQDFHNYDKSNPINITVIFSNPLTSNPNIRGFLLTYDGNECNYFCIDQHGSPLTYNTGREIRVSNDMKDEVPLMYLGLEREASQQVKSTQWTIYGKLLRYIDRSINTTIRDNFKNQVQAAYDSNLANELVTLETLLKTHVKQQTGLDLHLRMRLFEPLETLKNLRPYIIDPVSNLEFDAEDVGAGTQSALAVAIARAYGQLVRQPLVLAIEEPELYLHPHGCRNFYRILQELSMNGVQVFYTTHDRCFVDISKFESIRHIKRNHGMTTIHYATLRTVTAREQLAKISKFDDNINEVFFAHYAILVEGAPDKIACRIALEKLGVDLDKNSISIIDCTGLQNIGPIAQILQLLDIPVCVLIDEDPGNPTTLTKISDLTTLLGSDRVFLQSPNLQGIFGLRGKPSKIDALSNFPGWFNTNAPQPVYLSLKQKVCP